MKQQFYRLFAFLLLSAALVIWSFSQLITLLYPEQDSYMINIEQLLDTGLAAPQRDLVPKQQLALPVALEQLLAEGKTIAVQHGDDGLFYYQASTNSEQLLRFGPVASSKHHEELMPILVLVFYACLALVAVWLLWPVFRDLHTLQQKALQFGEKPGKTDLKPGKSSAIYPLAKVFDKVANQIVELAELHKSLSKTLSHEVRTPLARMRFALELSEQHLPADYRNQLDADLDEIEQLATNYLNFAKLEYLRQDDSFEPVNLAAFIAALQQRFSLYQQRIQIDFQHRGESCQFDQAAMLIAAQNLVNNALRFARQQIRVRLYAEDQGWLLSVEDDGPGFTDTNLQILQAFKREQDDERGFGLGLYIVQQIARWHRAEINVGQSSELGGAKVSLHGPRLTDG